MRRVVKKLTAFLAAMAALGLLTACGSSKEAEEAETAKPSEIEEAAESEPQEELPAAAEYTSADGMYKVTLLEGLEQTDLQFQSNSSMMGLDAGTDRQGFSAVCLGSPKTSVPGNPAQMESLEDYADHVAALALDGTGISVDWTDTEAEAYEGAQKCLAREGTARSGAASGKAYGYYIETGDSYYAVMLVGNDGDVEDARKVMKLELLEGGAAASGTKAFFKGMTAVLDTVNGASVIETVKTLEDMGGAESDLAVISSQAVQTLADSWGVEDAAGLMEMADWLMNEGHNKDALDYLNEFGGTNAADRAALEASLEGEDDETRYSVLMAYDAWTAYGDAAISAWDLSRLGTIMGFGYAAGYCTYEEAMDKSLEAAKKAQESFGSWEDFNQSYLYGYAYWMGENLEDPESSAAERVEILDNLTAQTNGVFSADWNMELNKEW
ncbi:MAG: DUF1266 domain-containing protein [Lachnospiraceae bacterium]|nr:DUF1266 domain-containing protein [Lachnospiraceae bacterium]